MTETNNLFFELIRVAIGNQVCLSHTPSADEWGELYAMAKKQSLVGVCFAGVQKLTTNHPSIIVNLSESLRLLWMGMAAKIQQRNELLNKQCVELQKSLKGAGLRSSILKGQGVAALHCENLRKLRQSGDIDVWVPGDYQRMVAFLKEEGVVGKVTSNHAEAHFFQDTEVEVHPVPAIFRNPVTNRRWRMFCKEHEDDCMTKRICLYDHDNKNVGICVPSLEFNLVFLMVHMYQHTLREGIGLRQFMDYYFVLKSRNNNHDDDNLLRFIESFGMKNFAAGVMYIMKSVFGMDEQLLLCPADPKIGVKLLDEIMNGGNFGHYDERNKDIFTGCTNGFHRVWLGLKRNKRFLSVGFWEIVCSPLWRLWHFCWMKKNGYR